LDGGGKKNKRRKQRRSSPNFKVGIGEITGGGPRPWGSEGNTNAGGETAGEGWEKGFWAVPKKAVLSSVKKGKERKKIMEDRWKKTLRCRDRKKNRVSGNGPGAFGGGRGELMAQKNRKCLREWNEKN